MSTRAKKSIFHSAFDAMVEARSRQAQNYVNGALLMLDDETLRARGYDRKELQKRGGAYSVF